MEPRSTPTSEDDESRLRLIIEAAPNAMLLVNDQGRIVLVNSEAERSFGYAREELLALRVEDLLPARSRGAHAGFRTGYLAAPSRRGMGVGRELYGLRKDGTEMPIEIGLNPIEIGGETFVLASIIDITERLAAQAADYAVRDGELRRSILDTMPFSILATDMQGRITTANPAAEHLLGRPQHQLVGVLLTEIDTRPRQVRPDGQSFLGGLEGDEHEWSYRRPDGSEISVNEAIVALRGGDGDPVGFLAVAYDITHRIQARERVEHMLGHDSLTDLPNRAKLMAELAAAFEAAQAQEHDVALLLLDLDHFKRVNDSLGHDVGDEMLVRIADRLLSSVREGDLVARLGGDEFGIVLHGVARGRDLTARVEELRKVLLAPVRVLGYELTVGATVGGAVFPRDGDDPVTLLRHADTAMNHAKAAGRASLQWFHESMVEETREKLALSNALRRALAQGELALAYQPQVELATGEVVGMEALARWSSPDFGEVPPDRFIPVAEDSGLIVQLGEWVLRRACADLGVLQAELGRHLRLAVNVSPRQLRDGAWGETVRSALGDAGLEPSQLELEITEGLLMDDHGQAVGVLEGMRDLGVRIVLDDFGRGYSSLAYLTRFPIDALKIDRSFVQGITGSRADAAIVDAIVVMAHALGMSVLAEGVETVEQEAHLRALGCDEAQGFRYSRAVRVASVAEAVRDIAGLRA